MSVRRRGSEGEEGHVPVEICNLAPVRRVSCHLSICSRSTSTPVPLGTFFPQHFHHRLHQSAGALLIESAGVSE